MSRSSHELNKAKARVLEAGIALQADRNNELKKQALVIALDDLERDRRTIQGAMLKALLGVNPTPNLLTASDVAKASDPPSGAHDLTDRIRKARGESQGREVKLNLTGVSSAPVKRLNAPGLYRDEER